MLAEILRYPVEKVTYLELDPALIKLVRDFPTSLTEKELRDPRLDIVYADGRRFLNTVEAKYDIIMVNLPMPSTLQLNRFYTKEFFAEARRSIGDDGLLTLAVPGSLSQISSELRNLNATILSSLKDLFFVFVIPGYSNIYIAAKKEIFIAPNVLVSRLAERGVRTRTFNRSYLKERLSRQWAEWFDQLIWQYDRIGKNLDLAPRATFYAVSHWNALFSPGLSIVMRVLNRLNLGSILMAIALAAAIAYSASLHIRQPVKVIGGFAIFSTGFTVMALNLILIYAYQSFYGFVFHHIAVLASAFMIGLVAGGWLATRSLPLIRNNTAVFFGMESFAAVFSLAVGGILLYLDRQGAFRFPAVFFFLIMVTGALIGAEFPIVNKLCLKGAEGADTAGLLYALDLAGSWFAALIVSAALVPLIGIPGTCVALAMLKILSGALVVSGRD
jgi:spermidine synthase